MPARPNRKSKELYDAVSRSDSRQVLRLLQAGADPNYRDPEDEMSCLAMSAWLRDFASCKLLLDYGADQEFGGPMDAVPIANAILSGSERIVRMLIRRGFPVAGRLAKRITLTHVAIRSRKPDKMMHLLQRLGAPVDAGDSIGETPLLDAVFGENIDAVRLLIRWGADVNRADRYGIAPLHFAASRQDSRFVRVLLRAGADPRARTRNGNTALMATLGSVRVARILLAAGTPLNARTTGGQTALMHAIWKPAVVKFLLSQGAHMNTQDFRGDTPLHWASRIGNVQCVRLLLAAGAKQTIKNHAGKTPVEQWDINHDPSDSPRRQSPF